MRKTIRFIATLFLACLITATAFADTRKNGATSNIIRVVLKNSSTGAPLTGLDESSTGLIISTIANNEASATAYTVAGSKVETISTLGTFAAPTATKVRFKQVDSTNHPGLYELQIADARFAVSSAKALVVSLSGATNLMATDYEVTLVAYDPQDTVRMGLTALPNAAANANGGLPILSSSGTALAYTVPTVTTVTNQLTTAQIATGVWQDATSGDFTTSSSIGKSLYTSGVVPGGTNGLFIAGTNAATTITTGLTTHFIGTVDTLTTYTGNTPQTGDSYARLGAPAGASVSADVAAIKANTTEILSDIATSGVGIGTKVEDIGSRLPAALGANGNMKSDVRDYLGNASPAADTAGYFKVTIKDGTGTGEIDTSSGTITVGTNNDKTGYRLSATGVDDIWDEVQSGHSTSGTFGKYLDAAVSGVSTGGVSAADIATAVWQDTTSGDFTTNGSIGKALFVSAAPGAAGGHLIAGSNAATTFATLTSTGAFTVNGVSNVSQTGDSYARIGANGAGLTGVATTTGDKQTQIELLFSYDATATYSSSVAGSFIKELATNVSGGGSGGLTAQETADAVFNLLPASTPAANSLGAKINTLQTSVDDILASGLDFPALAAGLLDNGVAGTSDVAGGAPSDINIEPVPTSRTFVLVPRAGGLRSEDTKTIIAGSPGGIFAVDFRNDAAANQKIYSVEAVTLVSGTSGGITFGTTGTDWGKEGSQVKLTITGVTAGNYTLRFRVRYGSAAGPTGRGDITIKVVD